MIICAESSWINLELGKALPEKEAKTKKLEAQWQAQLEKLKEYKRIDGDCNVPHHYEKDPSLGIWVSNQRRKYAQMKDGKTFMDPDRMRKLELLGFEWLWYNSKRAS